jgi:hypothetical protein
MNWKYIASIGLAAAACCAFADTAPRLADYKLQDEETLGPVKGARSITAGGSIVWVEGDSFGSVAITYGMFVDRNWEPYGELAWAFTNVSGGSDLLLYGIGVRYHFVGDTASRTIPYLFVGAGGANPETGPDFQYLKVGGGANFFTGPQRAFYVALYQTFFNEDFVDDTTTLEIGMRIFTK